MASGTLRTTSASLHRGVDRHRDVAQRRIAAKPDMFYKQVRLQVVLSSPCVSHDPSMSAVCCLRARFDDG
jgi:hypothetical protein